MDNKIVKVDKKISKKAVIITASVIVILIAATLIGIVIYKNLEKKVLANETQIDIYGVDIYDEVPDTKEVEKEIAIDNEKQEEKTDEVNQDEVDKVSNSAEEKQEQNNTNQAANNNVNNNTQEQPKQEAKPVEQPKQEQQVSKPVEQPAQTQQPVQKPAETVQTGADTSSNTQNTDNVSQPENVYDETNDGATVVDVLKTNKFVRFEPNIAMANKLKTIALANMSDYWNEKKIERGWNVIVSSELFDNNSENYFTYHEGEFEGICSRTAIGNVYVYAVDEIWTNGDYEYVFQTRCYHN